MSEQTNGGDLSGIAAAISRITSDPDMMKRLRAAVGGDGSETPGETGDVIGSGASDGDGGDGGNEVRGAAESLSEVLPIRRAPAWSGADRRKLLEALRPFLSSERREKADSLINVIALLDSGSIDVIAKGGR